MVLFHKKDELVQSSSSSSDPRRQHHHATTGGRGAAAVSQSTGDIMTAVSGPFHKHQVDNKLAEGEGHGKHGFNPWNQQSYSRVLQKKNSFLCHLDAVATDQKKQTTTTTNHNHQWHNPHSVGSIGGETQSSSNSNINSPTADDHHQHHHDNKKGLRSLFRKVKSLGHRRPHQENQNWN